MKIIALDYDDTYTADPDLFGEFIKSAEAKGHIIVCVTFRHQESHPIENFGVEIFYTGGKPKAKYMRDQNFEPDIWIDDWPELIGKTRYDS